MSPLMGLAGNGGNGVFQIDVDKCVVTSGLMSFVMCAVDINDVKVNNFDNALPSEAFHGVSSIQDNIDNNVVRNHHFN